MVLVASPMFWGIGNHLGPLSEYSDQPEGIKELGAGAVGGQEVKFFTWGVTLLLSMLETWFWTQNQCFEAWGITWDNFRSLRST